jgi:F420-dependent methylenetetrahydromethanopterin dehydrogenase
MRISSHENDHGYDAFIRLVRLPGKNVVIKVDGVEIKGCFTTDDEESVVEIIIQDKKS